MTTEATTKAVYRDSILGRFVRQQDAERRPRTTEKQRVRRSESSREPFTRALKKGGAR